MNLGGKTFDLSDVKKIGKDRFLILFFMGVLLVVVCIPADKFVPRKNRDRYEQQAGSENRGGYEQQAGRGNQGGYEQQAGRGKQERAERALGDGGAAAIMPSEEPTASKDFVKAYQEATERELEGVLRVMNGVGEVRVFLTVRSSKERVVEKDFPYTRNNTNETDAEGGNRNISEMNNEEGTVYIYYADGSKEPYVTKEMEPVVEGVLVVAQGGGNQEVRESITQALMALFNLEEHKIKVAQMKGVGK